MERYKRMELRLLPTKSQEKLLWEHVHGARAVKNIFVARCYQLLDEKKSLNKYELKKEMTQLLKLPEYQYLKSIARHTIDRAIIEVYETFLKLFKHQIKRVKFKSKRTASKSFSVRNDGGLFRREGRKFQVTKIGLIKTSKKSFDNVYNIISFIEQNDKIMSPVIKFDGKFWILSLLYRDDLYRENQSKDYGEALGIDLGIKELAVCSNGNVYKNINKTNYIKKIEKRLARKQRQLNRKHHLNKEGNSFRKTKNYLKLEKEIKLLYRKITNIRENYINNITKELAELYPQEIVMEDLKVSNFMKHKHLAKSVFKMKWFDFRMKMEYKCVDRRILFTVASKHFPSSQLCSNCGSKKTKRDKLNLSHRVYECSCGYKEDRDLNASINLKNYRFTDWYNKRIVKDNK